MAPRAGQRSSTIVVGVTGDDPARWLDTTIAPAIDGIASLPTIGR